MQDAPLIIDDRKAPGVSDDLTAPGVSDDRKAPGVSDDLTAPGVSDDRKAPGVSDDRKAPGVSDDLTAPGVSDDRGNVPVRVVLAKLGLDGHDRGLKVVARMLRDAGMEVVYLGLRQTTETVIAAVEQEDADAIGLSMHNAGHMALAPRMVQAVADAGLDVPVIVGGIVPEADVSALEGMGISAVLHPGASAREVVEAVHRSLR